jgi:hypothetical protein
MQVSAYMIFSVINVVFSELEQHESRVKRTGLSTLEKESGNV